MGGECDGAAARTRGEGTRVMSVPELTPVETPIFDDMVIERLEEHFDDEIPCEATDECDSPAEVRATILCQCNTNSKLLCFRHLNTLAMRFALGLKSTCGICDTDAVDYRVVPL